MKICQSYCFVRLLINNLEVSTKFSTFATSLIDHERMDDERDL